MTESDPKVSLEQYAGVQAALDVGLPLAAILEQEQIEEAALLDAKPVWQARIAESMETFFEYSEKLRIAKDVLARKLPPIDDDPAAWVGVLAALATSLDQAETLAALGITLEDVGRLGRAWKRKMKAEPELEKKVAELAKSPKTPKPIVAGPLELKPFPWTPAPKPKAATPTSSAEALVAKVDGAAEGSAPQRVLASFQVVEAAPKEAPSEEQSFASWTVERYAQLAWGLRTRPAEADLVMQRAGLATMESRRLVHEHFRRRFETEPGLRAQFDAWLAAAAAHQQRGSAPPPRLGGTDELDTSQLLRRRAPVPFPMEAEQKPDSSRKRAQNAADERLAKHGDDAAVLERMKAAFKGKPLAEGGTAHVDHAALQRPLPFSQRAGAIATPPSPSVAKQQSGMTVEAQAPLGWTLERYARLCVDLQSSGLGQAQVLSNARLSPQAQALLDAYWQPRLKAEPELFAEWQRHAKMRAAELRRP